MLARFNLLRSWQPLVQMASLDVTDVWCRHFQFFSPPSLSLHLRFDNAVIFVWHLFLLFRAAQTGKYVYQSIARVTFQSFPVPLQLQKASRPCWTTTLVERHEQPLLLLSLWWIHLSGARGCWMAAFLNRLPLIIARRHHLKWRRRDKMSWRNKIEQKSGCVLFWGGIPGHLPDL